MQEQIEKISKKEFMNMLAKADVDDTTEFWESIYDGIYQSGREDEREQYKQRLINRYPELREKLQNVDVIQAQNSFIPNQ